VGDVAVAQGQLNEAARNYGWGLAIIKKLVEADPSNAQWQRDLYMSYCKSADLAERRNKSTEAKGYWKQGFEVLSDIDKRGLHIQPEDWKNLEILRQKASATPP
jgi:hypothetical protein